MPVGGLGDWDIEGGLGGCTIGGRVVGSIGGLEVDVGLGGR